jgi:hypothetical protein
MMEKDIKELMADLRTAQLRVRKATDAEAYADRLVRQALYIALDLPAGDRVGDIEIGHWDCDSSPIGICVYDDWSDSIHDYCLCCDEPEERK